MAVALVLLLAVVGTLQYRWIGDVSAAERRQLRESLSARTTDVADAIDGEFTRLYSAFQLTASQLDADPASALTHGFERAERESAFAPAVRELFLVDSARSDAPQRLDRSRGALEPASWPPALASLATRLSREPGLQAVSALPVPPGLIVVDAAAPALVVPVPTIQTPVPAGPGQMLVRTLPAAGALRAVVLWLDADRLGDSVVPPLVERAFGAPATSDFDVEVRRLDGTRVYATSPSTTIDPRTADATREVLRIRLDAIEWTRAMPSLASSADGAGAHANVSITIVRRGGPGQAPDARAPLGGGPAWTLLVHARRGSVDAVVARSRTRNLAVSFGALAVLGAGLVLLGVTAAREQRRSAQQLAFVASVSHELKTPLAVIRSAADNLVDGVVGPEQVGRYGALIRDEGRRLSAMVDRVMDFAGARAGALVSVRDAVSLGALVAEVVSAAAPDAARHGIVVGVVVPEDGGPVVHGDPGALRSATANGVANAVKYSLPGSRVDVSVDVSGGRARVTVADRGVGVDPDDMPHLFEPFFRGRRALASQVRGSGVGLAIVRDVMTAHRGTATIDAREGGGTVLTLELPCEARTA